MAYNARGSSDSQGWRSLECATSLAYNHPDNGGATPLVDVPTTEDTSMTIDADRRCAHIKSRSSWPYLPGKMVPTDPAPKLSRNEGGTVAGLVEHLLSGVRCEDTSPGSWPNTKPAPTAAEIRSPPSSGACRVRAATVDGVGGRAASHLLARRRGGKRFERSFNEVCWHLVAALPSSWRFWGGKSVWLFHLRRARFGAEHCPLHRAFASSIARVSLFGGLFQEKFEAIVLGCAPARR